MEPHVACLQLNALGSWPRRQMLPPEKGCGPCGGAVLERGILWRGQGRMFSMGKLPWPLSYCQKSRPQDLLGCPVSGPCPNVLV